MNKITLAKFQMNAIRELMFAMESRSINEIILKSPTGSGKTIILTHFMHEYMQGHAKTVFVWLTPGKGDLEEQSKAKMDRYIHNSHTKLLSDVMTSGFCENDSCFINWEKLTKKGNNALKDSERTNFLEWIERAHDDGLTFKIVVDESHVNDSIKADEILQYFHTDKIIRCSATPNNKTSNSTKLIEIPEVDVIEEGLIKKVLIINENFEQEIHADDTTGFLLERALEKQRLLRSRFLSRDRDINPLIVVQLPNKSEALCDRVQEWFATKGITVENEQLAIWLSDRHDNTDGISENNAKSVVVIMKQAVATGWDCPRAHILVKLREGMDETFEIQTIGRIRRMPEAKHYNDEELDSCYLYTFDRKFTEGVKNHLGKGALNEKTIFLKNEYKQVKLVKEQRTSVTLTRSPNAALSSIRKHFENVYGITGDKAKNKIRLESQGYVFSDHIVRYSYSGKIVTFSELENLRDMNVVKLHEPINTHIHGREHHHDIGVIGLEIGMPYTYMATILGKLFGEKHTYNNKILSLLPRELYAFIINNMDLLRRDSRLAMADEMAQGTLKSPEVSKKDFFIPSACKFTYDENAKKQTESEKNVYRGYLLSAEPRSKGERRFEKFCENSKAVDWFYKNGDKGDEYLSIVYYDNSDAQKLFYPDYILSVRGELWIIETKGGFTRSGDSLDIDIFSPKKFTVLKDYLERHGLKGGFVRIDNAIDELCICTEKYSDDLRTDAWKLLEDVIY